MFVTGEIRESKINVEQVFPFTPDNRQGLYFREIHVVKRENGEDFGKAAGSVGKSEYERGFVFIGSSKHLIRRPTVRYSEEAGEIPFVSLDPLGKDFHLVDLGGQFPAYRRMSFQLVLRDPPGTHGGIFFLYHLGVGQSIEEIGTLHQRYRS